MSLVINSNLAATAAATNLQKSNTMLQKSLARLSSGSKIVNPADDAGGLAVSMKLSSAIKRTDAVNTNISNAISFLQSQDGAMQTVGEVLDRIGELRLLFEDVTKSSTDQANYNTEFLQLQEQLSNISAEKFNGIDLFNGTALAVTLNEDASQSLPLFRGDIDAALAAVTNTASVSSLGDITVSGVTSSIQNIANFRATNGALVSRLQFATDLLTINRTNLEAANSRIKDTDVASESTEFARANILVQSGTAMLAQANQTPQAVLRLLQ